MMSEKISARPEEEIANEEEPRVFVRKVGEKVLDVENFETDATSDNLPSPIRAKDFAKELGFKSDKVIKRIMASCGIEGSVLSPEQQDEIKSKIWAPEGYISIDEFIEQHSLSKTSFMEKVKKSDGNIHLERFISNKGRPLAYISPEDQSWFLNEYNDSVDLGEVEDGYSTIGDFADEIKVSWDLVDHFIKNNHLKLRKFKTSDGIKQFLSPEQKEAFISENTELINTDWPPNDDYLSIYDIADKYNVGVNFVYSHINLDSLQKYRSRRGIVYYLSPEQQEKFLSENSDHIFLEEPPDETYITINTLADKIGRDRGTIDRAINLLGIETSFFKNPGNSKAAKYITEDDAYLIDDFLTKKPPRTKKYTSENNTQLQDVDGFISISDIVDLSGINESRVRNFIKDKDVHVFQGKNGRPAYYISKEDYEALLIQNDDFESISPPPDGYRSVSELAADKGISIDYIKTFLKKNVEFEKYIFRKDGKKAARYLSPEQQEQIRLSYEEKKQYDIPPSGYVTINEFAGQLGKTWNSIKKRIPLMKENDLSSFRNKGGAIVEYLSPDQRNEILQLLEEQSPQTSIPENTVAFYLKKAEQTIKQGFRPDWLKNPETGHNLEVDIFVDPPGVGIEYDGYYYHQDIERDARKDSIARKSGYRIFHIREDGCPEMPEGSVCINRKNNADDTDLGECIKECFETIGIPVPDIDVARDKKDIMAFMRQRVLDKLDSARTFEELSVVS